MKKIYILFTAAVFAVALAPSFAFAAKSVPIPTTVEYIGYDISWPQCGRKLPTGQAFGIVGINGGNAANTNPCLAAQLAWASKSTGATAQKKVQLYVNTANPGEVLPKVSTWPTNNVDSTGAISPNPHGSCSGLNDLACSWQYGWNRAVDDYIVRFLPAAASAKIDPDASAYVWWLDVEMANSWQALSPESTQLNAATLEGMTSYFDTKNAQVGIYSTAVQWKDIVGNSVGTSSNLNGLANWRPSGASLSNAIANCTVAPLTAGGYISLTQYVQQNLDKNHSCIK